MYKNASYTSKPNLVEQDPDLFEEAEDFIT
jgi:hypothetical protein